jgi:hypothetical protein
MDRQHDIELILKELENPSITSQQRILLKKKLNSIANESRKVKSMREQLIKAHRAGRSEEVNDIRDFVKSHREFSND